MKSKSKFTKGKKIIEQLKGSVSDPGFNKLYKEMVQEALIEKNQ